MKKLYIAGLIAMLGMLLFPSEAFAQFSIPEKPSLQTSVYDYAKVLKDDEKTKLEEKLVEYSKSTTTQIVIITIESLKGESIADLSTKWAQGWGIGQADKDNGVLILLAKEERKIWITLGYGVDDRLTAGELGQMTRDVIIPEFKGGSYYKGLDKGTDAIFQMLTGKYKAEPSKNDAKRKSRSDDGPGGGIIFGIIILIVIIAVFSKRGGGGTGGGGRGFTGSTLGDILVLSSLGRSFGGGSRGGGFGGSSGGGGFGGGFGGGGFSGGGAGGSW